MPVLGCGIGVRRGGVGGVGRLEGVDEGGTPLRDGSGTEVLRCLAHQHMQGKHSGRVAGRQLVNFRCHCEQITTVVSLADPVCGGKPPVVPPGRPGELVRRDAPVGDLSHDHLGDLLLDVLDGPLDGIRRDGVAGCEGDVLRLHAGDEGVVDVVLDGVARLVELGLELGGGEAAHVVGLVVQLGDDVQIAVKFRNWHKITSCHALHASRPVRLPSVSGWSPGRFAALRSPSLRSIRTCSAAQRFSPSRFAPSATAHCSALREKHLAPAAQLLFRLRASLCACSRALSASPYFTFPVYRTWKSMDKTVAVEDADLLNRMSL